MSNFLLFPLLAICQKQKGGVLVRLILLATQPMEPSLRPPEWAGGAVLGDIVEHTFDAPSHCSKSKAVRLPVASGGFPTVRRDRSYGMHSSSRTPGTDVSTTMQRVAGQQASAHIQPEDPTTMMIQHELCGKASFIIPKTSNLHTRTEGEPQPVLPVGGGPASASGSAYQWQPSDFQSLFQGYYERPLPVEVVRAHDPTTLGAGVPGWVKRAGGEEAEEENFLDFPGGGAVPASPPTGEEFFVLVFQCLRSRVRRHQEVGLHALLLHLVHEADAEAEGSLPGGRLPRTLRERCLHGPDCAPFLFFILEVLSGAGHPQSCALAAACLLLLLHTTDNVEEALGELGAPRTDAPDDEEGRHDDHVPVAAHQDDVDLPFADISEMLRGDAWREGLECMGYTRKVMAAMPLLSADATEPQTYRHVQSPPVVDGLSVGPPGVGDAAWRMCGTALWLELLLCGNLGGSSETAQRVAEDPLFAALVTRQWQAVVLGECTLAECVPLLLVLGRLAHFPVLLPNLLRHSSSREIWELLVVYVCTMDPSTVKRLLDVAAVSLLMLLLRDMVRHGLGLALMTDLCGTLVREGIRMGSAIPLEMWVLHVAQMENEAEGHCCSDPSSSLSSRSQVLQEAALAALQVCALHEEQFADPLLEGECSTATIEPHVAQLALRHLVNLSTQHFLATYLRAHPVGSLHLLGSAVESQSRMQALLALRVARPEVLVSAFGRLQSAWMDAPTTLPSKSMQIITRIVQMAALHLPTAPRPCMEAAAVNVEKCTKLSRATRARWLLALQAGETHATLRLATAILRTYPAIDAEPVVGLAAALTSKYAGSCLRVTRRAVQRLQPDEIMTMGEVLSLLAEHSPSHPKGWVGGPATDGKPQRGALSHDSQLAALFLLHSVAVTKHCLDAAPVALRYLLGHSTSSSGESQSSGLLQSLLTGVQTAPIPTIDAARGAARPWILYPLYDDTFADKPAWSRWVRQILGLHANLKVVLGWDALLVHTLLWVLAHREMLFRGEDAGSENTARALEVLVLSLTSLLVDVADTTVSPMAAEALSVLLGDYANPHCEDPLSSAMTVCLTALATQCAPATALAVLAVLMSCPVGGGSPSRTADESAEEGTLAIAAFRRLRDALRGYGVSGHLQPAATGARRPPWALEEVVALLQLVGPFAGQHPHCRPPPDGDKVQEGRLILEECLAAFTNGVVQAFVEASGGGLRHMATQVLRGIVEAVGWAPPALQFLL